MRWAVEFPLVAALTLLLPGVARWWPAWRQAEERRSERVRVEADCERQSELLRAAGPARRSLLAAEAELDPAALEQALEALALRCPEREDGPAEIQALLERVRASGVVILRATPEPEPQDFLTAWRAHRLQLELRADYAGLRALLVDLENSERLLRVEDLVLRPSAEEGQVEARLTVARFTRRAEGDAP